MTYDEAMARHRELADERGPLVLRRLLGPMLTDAEAERLDAIEHELDEVEAEAREAASRAAAYRRARVPV